MDKIKLIVVFIIIIGFFGFLLGFQHGQNKGSQDLLTEQKGEEQKEVDEAEKEREYNLILNKVCSLPSTKSRAIDMTKCAVLKENDWSFFDLDGIKRLEEELEGMKTFSFCSKKVTELKLGELIECLNSKDTLD